MNNLISNLPAFPNLGQTGSAPPSGAADGEGDFGSVLKNAINQVEELHGSAQQQVTDLLKGDRGVNHVCYNVDDLRAAVAAMAEAGVRLGHVTPDGIVEMPHALNPTVYTAPTPGGERPIDIGFVGDL